MKGEITPAADWLLKSRVVLLDAYMRNPIEVRITKHANENHVITEDDRGIVYFARTDRIVGFCRQPVDEYEDLLG